jgi:hypothetical protein
MVSQASGPGKWMLLGKAMSITTEDTEAHKGKVLAKKTL